MNVSFFSQRSEQILCVTLVLGMTSDPEAQVRASAVRALGTLVIIPSLRRDVMFLCDAADAIVTLCESDQPQLRIKAVWSLGNLTDALAANK